MARVGRFIAALLVAAAISPLTARQQQPQQPSTVFRTSTRTVAVYSTVTSADGHLVTDLVRDDFAILDNDKPQPITLFANVIQPIKIVVMLDTSGSMTGNIGLLREGAVQLFTDFLPADQARVGSFGNRIQVSPGFTSSQDDLIRIVWTQLSPGGPTPLWGAVNAGMNALARVEGRRVVLVFTDGKDSTNRPETSLREVTARAQNEEFMIYAIGMWSRESFGFRPSALSPPDPGLKTLAEATGGGYFELLSTEGLGPAFARVAEELHHQYLLGFDAPVLDGKVHRLTVQVTKPGMTARGRKAYLAGKDKSP